MKKILLLTSFPFISLAELPPILQQQSGAYQHSQSPYSPNSPPPPSHMQQNHPQNPNRFNPTPSQPRPPTQPTVVNQYQHQQKSQMFQTSYKEATLRKKPRNTGARGEAGENILNNPFLNERVKKIIKTAIDKIVQEYRNIIRKEYESKIRALIEQNRVKVLQLQAKIKELVLKNKELELKLKLLEKKKKGLTDKPPFSFIKVNALIFLNGKPILKTNKGEITEGVEIEGWVVEKIDLKHSIVYLRNPKTDKITKVPLILP